VGLAAVIGKRLVVTKNLIDLDLPLLSIVTVLILGVAADKQVTFVESVILLVAYVVYLFYTMKDREKETAAIKKQEDLPDILPPALAPAKIKKISKEIVGKGRRPKVTGNDLLMLLAGMVGLFLGSKYLVQSVIELADIFKISTGLIAISAVALGTSLPELLVSVKAARQGKAEVAIGNIFGSNVFNLLLVIGLSGLITTLYVDPNTFLIGLPAMLLATLLFVVSAISHKIYIWEGMMFLLLYIVFIGKLFALF
jgi:cation:H+ antiporter